VIAENAMVQPALPASLLERLASLRTQAESYFERALFACGPADPYSSRDYWKELPEELRSEGEGLRAEVAAMVRETGLAFRRSPLLTEADEREAGHAFKGMRAALRFRHFEHWGTEILHDEGTVLGVRRAGESEDYSLHPSAAHDAFVKWADALESRLQLMNQQTGTVVTDEPSGSAKPIAAGYRPGTAFIMMWMSKDKPDLIDLNNTIKRCFEAFGIKAVRADDIEHEDVITNKILDEIKTAEFLFADLTGERPSVYYEVGYAHALGRRVILFRKAGTSIHFDLVAYNCPEYDNFTELEKKLMKRLEYVTGKAPTKR
jgi:hypothetical protein